MSDIQGKDIYYHIYYEHLYNRRGEHDIQDGGLFVINSSPDDIILKLEAKVNTQGLLEGYVEFDKFSASVPENNKKQQKVFFRIPSDTDGFNYSEIDNIKFNYNQLRQERYLTANPLLDLDHIIDSQDPIYQQYAQTDIDTPQKLGISEIEFLKTKLLYRQQLAAEYDFYNEAYDFEEDKLPQILFHEMDMVNKEIANVWDDEQYVTKSSSGNPFSSKVQIDYVEVASNQKGVAGDGEVALSDEMLEEDFDEAPNQSANQQSSEQSHNFTLYELPQSNTFKATFENGKESTWILGVHTTQRPVSVMIADSIDNLLNMINEDGNLKLSEHDIKEIHHFDTYHFPTNLDTNQLQSIYGILEYHHGEKLLFRGDILNGGIYKVQEIHQETEQTHDLWVIGSLSENIEVIDQIYLSSSKGGRFLEGQIKYQHDNQFSDVIAKRVLSHIYYVEVTNNEGRSDKAYWRLGSLPNYNILTLYTTPTDPSAPDNATLKGSIVYENGHTNTFSAKLYYPTQNT